MQHGELLPSYTRSKANNYLSWVGPAVARHDDFTFVERGYRSDAVSAKQWALNIIPNDTFIQRMEEVEEGNVVEQQVDEDACIRA